MAILYTFLYEHSTNLQQFKTSFEKKTELGPLLDLHDLLVIHCCQLGMVPNQGTIATRQP